jgi:hypothetical protein
MDSLFSGFLLFLAAITALLTYMIIPRIPVIVLTSGAAIALAAGVWWHWSHFAVDYRMSTWQEQLRSYASWVLVFVVILLSYAFYIFGWSSSSLQGYAAQAGQAIRSAGRTVSSRVTNVSTRNSNIFASSDSDLPEPIGREESTPSLNVSSLNRTANRNAANFLA